MKIMLKSSGEEKWQKISEKGYANESALQEILGMSPDLIPVGELSGGRKPIKVAIREGGLPGSGSTDLIGIYEYGNITIVETKLAKNEEIKRKVIGQILEYAAYLWQKPYEEFDDIFHRKLGGYLVDLMDKAEKENDEWSAEEFRDAVEANLKSGTFALFIVVDEINEELRRIIDYLNSKNFTDFELYALELKYFHDQGIEVVLPQLYGVANRTTSRNHKRVRWDETSFLEDAKQKLSKEGFSAVEKLYRFCKARANIDWGTGSTRGSFTAQFDIFSSKALFILRSNGRLSFELEYTRRRTPDQKQSERITRLTQELRKIDIKVPDDESWIALEEDELIKKVDALIDVLTTLTNS